MLDSPSTSCYGGIIAGGKRGQKFAVAVTMGITQRCKFSLLRHQGTRKTALHFQSGSVHIHLPCPPWYPALTTVRTALLGRILILILFLSSSELAPQPGRHSPPPPQTQTGSYRSRDGNLPAELTTSVPVRTYTEHR